MVVGEAFREFAKRLLLEDKPLRRASVGTSIGADSVVGRAVMRGPLDPRRLLMPDKREPPADDELLLPRPPLLREGKEREIKTGSNCSPQMT